ncbi:hypothetical protein IJU97_04890 [bacterium]|nr:hypothetical protein [bacterium]
MKGEFNKDKALEEKKANIYNDVQLNSEIITGSATYSGVVVKVSAPVESFPEGTVLKIKNVKQDKSIKTKEDVLLEQVEEIGEDTTKVSFDISFIYNGFEVQPVEGKNVSVVFDYENNEEFKKAAEDKNIDLVVYHVENNEEKVEKIDIKTVEEVKREVKQDLTEEYKEVIEENHEGDANVGIVANEFSVYTLTITVSNEATWNLVLVAT